METVHLPGDEPTLVEQEVLTSEIDMSPEARLARIEDVQGRMAAGETISITEINPKTHCPELVALVHQQRRRGIGVEL